MDHGRLFQRVESEFRALGYDVRHDILNAVDFGVPQQRERVILVGMKGENNYIFPVPTHGPGKKPYVTLKDAIGDLPQLKSGESASHYAGVAENEFLRFVRAGAGQLVTEHAAPKNGAHLIRIMQTLQDGQSKDDLCQAVVGASLHPHHPKFCLSLLLPLHSPAGFPRHVHPGGCPVAKLPG